MSIARTLASRLDDFRLRQARADAHRARIELLRADWLGGDLEAPSRRVLVATARLERLEAVLRRNGRPH